MTKENKEIDDTPQLSGQLDKVLNKVREKAFLNHS